MPNGNVHTAATVTLGVISVPSAFLLTDHQSALLFTGGILIGLIVTPDLDQGEIHSVAPQEMVGKVLGHYAEYIWRFLWYPYGLLVKHRSWISHFPVISTLLRLGYLYLWYLLLGWIFRVETIQIVPPIPLIVGMTAADTLHFILDQLPFFREKKTRRRHG